MVDKANELRGLAGAAPRAPLKAANPALRMPVFDDEEELELLDLSRRPDGMSYEWKRYTYLGKVDTKYQAQLKRRGWTEVPAGRHPEFWGDDAPGAAIDNDRILMERPEEWTKMSRQREKEKARANVTTQQQRLQVATHDMMPRLKANTRRTYEQVEVPPDDRGDPSDL